MCGIVAHISAGPGLSGHHLSASLAAMAHRGPDGSGQWHSNDRMVSLGLTRLAVVDLAAGAQPIANEELSIHAVVNGEFYGYERIRRELEGQGHQFRTLVDSEVLVHLYERDGLDCLRHLRGEFSFVLWDQRRRRLFAARDRFGIKPLCWSLTPCGFSIASEAKALFALGVPAAWDACSFLHAASHHYLPPARTPFAGVSSLPPGHVLLVEMKPHEPVRASDVRTFSYWDLDYPRDGRGSGAHRDDAAGRVHQRLEEAVRLRLRADVPIACYLSGGIDSAAVLALAARESSTPIDCFTACFDGGPYDERGLAREMAESVRANFHEVEVTQDAILDALPEAVFFSEGLAINGHLTAKYLLSRAIRRVGYKVVLSGEGADEVLLGYPHFRRDLLISEGNGDAAGTQARLVADNGLSAGMLIPDGDSLPLDAVRRRMGHVPSFLEAKATFGHRVIGLLSDDWRRYLTNWDPFDALLQHFDVPGQLEGRHPVEQSAYLWTKLALPSYILRTLGDGAEMANSVEGRLPFLDHVFFETVRDVRLPLTSGEQEKSILRRAMRAQLPGAVLSRRKHPFLAPPVSSRDRQFGFLRDMLSSKSFGAVPFFDQKRVVRWLDALKTQGAKVWTAADPALMFAVSATLLQGHFRLDHPA